MSEKLSLISQQFKNPIKIIKWKVGENSVLSIGSVILLYDFSDSKKSEQRKLKSSKAGKVRKLLAVENSIVDMG